MTLETQITVLISLAVAALLTVTAKYLIDIIQTLKKNVKTTNLGWMIEMTIEAGCLLAEKMFKSGEGQQKLGFVLNYVKMEALRMGITVDTTEVIRLINKFVDDVINEGKKKDAVQ